MKNKNHDEDDNVAARSALGLALPHALRPDVPQRLGLVGGLHRLGAVHLHRVSLQVIRVSSSIVIIIIIIAIIINTVIVTIIIISISIIIII